MKIDYQAGHLSGGHLAEIPEPHIRRWPGDPNKRKVTIHIMRYYDYGIHYYLSIFQENNPLWNDAEKIWQNAWDDKEGEGKTDTQLYLDGLIEHTRYDAYEIALGTAKMILKKFFPDHEEVWEDYCNEAKEKE